MSEELKPMSTSPAPPELEPEKPCCGEASINLPENMLIVVLIVVFVACAFIAFYLNSNKALKGSVKNGNTVLICGTRGSGKTSLLTRLVNDGKIDDSLKTQISQERNIHPFSDGYELIDVQK